MTSTHTNNLDCAEWVTSSTLLNSTIIIIPWELGWWWNFNVSSKKYKQKCNVFFPLLYYIIQCCLEKFEVRAHVDYTGNFPKKKNIYTGWTLEFFLCVCITWVSRDKQQKIVFNPINLWNLYLLVVCISLSLRVSTLIKLNLIPFLRNDISPPHKEPHTHPPKHTHD